MRKLIQGKEDLVAWCKQNDKQDLFFAWSIEPNKEKQLSVL